jgi:hypothetical protein
VSREPTLMPIAGLIAMNREFLYLPPLTTSPFSRASMRPLIELTTAREAYSYQYSRSTVFNAVALLQCTRIMDRARCRRVSRWAQQPRLAMRSATNSKCNIADLLSGDPMAWRSGATVIRG